MDLQEHLRRLEKNRGELLQSIEGLRDKQLTEEPVEGIWSIKAVLDHIAAGEIAAGKRPSLMDIQDFDACNARFVEERKQRSIQQTLEELATARQAFIQGPKGLPPELWQNETLQCLVKVIWEHDDAH